MTMLSSNGKILKISSGVDKFSNSPNMSVLQLSDQIQYGRVTNTSNAQGVFLIPQIDYDSYHVVERNFRFIIDAFNQYDNRAFPGEFWTGSFYTLNPFGTSYLPHACEIGTSTDIIDKIQGLTFQVGDEIEENIIIDNTNDVLKWKVIRNGIEVVNKTYQNQPISIGSRKFYVFGLRFENPAPDYNSKSTFIFSGSWIKADGSLIWGFA